MTLSRVGMATMRTPSDSNFPVRFKAAIVFVGLLLVAGCATETKDATGRSDYRQKVQDERGTYRSTVK